MKFVNETWVRHLIPETKGKSKQQNIRGELDSKKKK